MRVQFNNFNNHFVSNIYQANPDSLHKRRRMLAAQDSAKETEAVRVTISAEAMELSKKLKKMEQALQLPEPEETGKPEESGESVLTDEEIYDELLDQVRIWGDEAGKIRYKYAHKETKEMAAQKAAALTELTKLEELRRDETGRLERDAQKAAETASMQQEEINRKNSELIMMLESFEDQEDEEEAAEGKEADQDGTKQDETDSAGSMMEGRIGVSAAQREMQMLDTIDRMNRSGDYRIAANDQSIKGILDERKNIYRMNAEGNFSIREKIAAMSDFVGTLANQGTMEELFKKRIDAESDVNAKAKLQAMSDYFRDLDMKNQIGELTEDREFALQEKITARDLRIAHLGSRHLAMAGRQKEQLQALSDEDDILRLQGQGSITGRAEEVAERLQEKLDERDHVDKEADSEEIKKEETEQEEMEQEEVIE